MLTIPERTAIGTSNEKPGLGLPGRDASAIDGGRRKAGLTPPLNIIRDSVATVGASLWFAWASAVEPKKDAHTDNCLRNVLLYRHIVLRSVFINAVKEPFMSDFSNALRTATAAALTAGLVLAGSNNTDAAALYQWWRAGG